MKHFIITIFLAHFLLTAFAQNNVIIQAPDVQVDAGDEITYPITINPNGNSVGSFQFKIEYDSNLLEILNVEHSDGWDGAVNPYTPGIIRIGFFNIDVETAMFQAANLTFKVIGQAGQTSQIKLSEILVFGDISPLNYQFSNGSISINSCNPLDNACKADLVVNCGNASISGNTLSVSNVVVTNSGNAEARYSYIAYYLSSDADITSSDFLLGYDYISALGEGSTSNENTTIDLSNLNISEGTYYLGILADIFGQVDESNETNNTCYISNPKITIQDSPPQGTISVTAPGGSDSFAPGDAINIQWTDNISENVRIYLYSQSGSGYIVTSSTASDGSYSYTIPTYLSDGQYRIYIRSAANSTVKDYGDYFTIQTPTPVISLTAPGESDTFAPGDAINIQWTDNISENVRIYLYSQSGGGYIVVSSTASDGSYSYTIPTYLTDGKYRIYIRSAANSAVNDFSEYFTIQQQTTSDFCGDDSSTLLLLPYDNNLNGIGGETPTVSQYVSLNAGRYTNGVNVMEYSDTPSLKYKAANNINSQQGTVEAWVKPTWNGNDGKGHTILQCGAGGGILILKDGASNLRLIMNRFSPSGYPEQGVAYNISNWQANQWKHVAFTWGGGQLQLYIDGSRVARQSISTPLFPISDTEFNIGTDAGWNVWQGTIDHLRISSVVRSQTEINEFRKNCIGTKVEQDDILNIHSYPNPFTDHATITYTLPKDSPVTLTVYDASGKQVAVLHNNETKPEGTHNATFEGSLYPAGMYYYTIQAGEYFGTQKMILTK